jgi:hypothetical protein
MKLVDQTLAKLGIHYAIDVIWTKFRHKKYLKWNTNKTSTLPLSFTNNINLEATKKVNQSLWPMKIKK